MFTKRTEKEGTGGGAGVVAQAVQHHRRFDATQLHHQDALGGPAGLHPLKRDADDFAQLIAPCQFLRRCAGTGGAGVPDRILVSKLRSLQCEAKSTN